MKLAVLADIHANWQALQAVAGNIKRWQPDWVVVAGDVVNRGPSPAECWDFVLHQQRECGWQLVLGNHEEYVLHRADRARHAGRIQEAAGARPRRHRDGI